MKPKLLFVVTEDYFFWSHRLPLARAAQAAGYEVTVATRFDRHAEEIRREGFGVAPFALGRGGMNPFRVGAAVLSLAALYRRLRPDIVHHIAFKPIVVGSLAAKLAKVPAVVNTFTGLGYMYSSRDFRAALLRKPVELVLKTCLGGGGRAVIAQNPDDRRILAGVMGVPPESLALVRGSGVDPARYLPVEERAGGMQVAFISRMLWSKGVGDFVAAAAALRLDFPGVRFVLVGGTDPDNPQAVPPERLERWTAEGAVEWLGRRENVSEILAASHIVALPSTYGEGVPKILIEAAACGRPIVATDIPGCREIVRDGVNGRLVPPGNPVALAEAIRGLLADPAARRRMGAAGRTIVENEFSERQVLAETLEVYRSVMPTGSVARAR